MMVLMMFIADKVRGAVYNYLQSAPYADARAPMPSRCGRLLGGAASDMNSTNDVTP